MSGEKDLDYLSQGDAQDKVMADAVENTNRERFKRNYGSRDWKLLSGFKNLVDNYESMVHGMELATGVLVKSLEMRGGGGVSSSFVFMDGYHLEFDSKGDGIWVLEFDDKKVPKPYEL